MNTDEPLLQYFLPNKYNTIIKKRNYEIADLSSLPTLIIELVQVLTSDYMGLTLSNMTGLALHSSVHASKSNQDVHEDDDSDDAADGEDSDFEDKEFDDEESKDNDEESEQDDVDDGENCNENQTTHMKRKKTDSNSDNEKNANCENQPCTSSSITQSENLYKKFKTTQNQNTENVSATATTSASSNTDESRNRVGSPKYFCEIRRWKQGAYTLITDDDTEIKTKALDLMVFFKCKTWSLECGGNVSYIARDEDNEVMNIV